MNDVKFQSAKLNPMNADDVQMDVVRYGQVALCHPFSAAAPSLEDWVMYRVCGDGVSFALLSTGEAATSVPRNAIIATSALIPARFMSEEAVEAPDKAWIEEPWGAAIEKADVVITVGRIQQSTMSFVAAPGNFLKISPAEEPELNSSINVLLDIMLAEIRSGDPSAKAIIARLSEVVALKIGQYGRARSLMLRDLPKDVRYDARIWRAIVAVSTDPEKPWTVESMAMVAGMSRTSFAIRYREIIGTTPLKALRRLRLQRAATLLLNPKARTVEAIAQAMGYGSEAAFCRAFTQEFGLPPRRYRTGHLGHQPPKKPQRRRSSR